MQKYFEILKKCPLFFDIEENELSALLKCLGAKVSSFEKKYTMFMEGSPVKYIGILLSGSAQIVSIDYFGNRSILSGINAGEVFGESFACAELSRIPVSVVANESCEIMLIDYRRILHPCENSCGFHNRLIFNLMKSLAEKNIMFHKKIEVTSKRTTREKLLCYLDFEAKRAGSNKFSIPFDRQELADYLEEDRSGLSSENGKLTKEGILESKKKKFRLF